MNNFSINIDLVNQNTIVYPRFSKLHKDIQMCIELSKNSLEPQCMCLEGEAGIGKSTLVQSYISKMGRRVETETGVEIPIFYAAIPASSTVKGTASCLLNYLGDPGFNKGTLWSMTSRLVGLIKSCKVELVILDEFSNLINTENNSVLTSVAEWLKMLIKHTKIPFVVVGVKGRIIPVLESNPQLFRLFSCVRTFEPFSWRDEETIQEFILFVQYAEDLMKINFDPMLPKPELFHRLFYVTGGIADSIIKLIRAAAFHARETEQLFVGMNELSMAFIDTLGNRKVKNPFLTDIRAHFVPPERMKPKKMLVEPTLNMLLSKG